MRTEIIHCDICGKQTDIAEILEIPTGKTYVDSPTGKTEEVTQRLDLCPPCLRKELSAALSNLSEDRYQQWLTRVTGPWRKNQTGCA